MYDLIVIGGGPAGSSAAITAARAGARVLQLERGRFPRHKVCGEFVSAESLGLLSSLVDSRHAALLHAAPRISGGRVFLDGHTLNMPIDPPAASMARFDLDLALWQSAGVSGVEAKQLTAVQSISGGGPFVVATSSGSFTAGAVINASGRWSNLTQTCSTQNPKWLGLKAHFAEQNAPPSVDLYFFEGGYCGVQPLNGNAINACAMVRADRANSLADVLRLHPALWERSWRWKPVSEPVSTSPLIFGRPEPEKDGILMAGDAAGFVDPFVGDGISLALRSGALAAECVGLFFRGTPLSAARAGYCREYERRFGRIFRTSSQLRQMLRLPGRIRKPLLFALKRTPGITRRLVNRTR